MQDWIIRIIETLGYTGLGLLMFIENLFPPIPSEVIMPMAGFAVQRGHLDFSIACLVGITGTILGAIPWYCLGRWLGHEYLAGWADRYGKYVGINRKDLDRAKGWFERHGTAAVFFGRLIPGVRTFISIPAGACEMKFWPFMIYSTMGTAIWVTVLMLAGYKLGANYTVIEPYVSVVSKVVLVGLVTLGGVWVLRRRKLARLKPPTPSA